MTFAALWRAFCSADYEAERTRISHLIQTLIEREAMPGTVEATGDLPGRKTKAKAAVVTSAVAVAVFLAVNPYPGQIQHY